MYEMEEDSENSLMYLVSCKTTSRNSFSSNCNPVTALPVPERGSITWYRSANACESRSVSVGELTARLGEAGLEMEWRVTAGEFVAESRDFGLSLCWSKSGKAGGGSFTT